MPHFSAHEREKGAGAPPKGMMAIRVGQEGEERRRFVVPVAHLNHPLFAQLLREAEEEYGFRQEGAIVIPCDVEHFLHVEDAIDREISAGAAGGHHRHHRHEGPHVGAHHHLPQFTACFGA